jgi:hypothetical protein
MSVPCKFERSLLSHEEYETIRVTHHPAIYDVEVAELEAMRPRLRKMREAAPASSTATLWKFTAPAFDFGASTRRRANSSVAARTACNIGAVPRSRMTSTPTSHEGR